MEEEKRGDTNLDSRLFSKQTASEFCASVNHCNSMFGNLERVKQYMLKGKELISDRMIKGRLEDLAGEWVSAKTEEQRKKVKQKAYKYIRDNEPIESRRKTYRVYFNNQIPIVVDVRQNPQKYENPKPGGIKPEYLP